ncbi:hypothetical protein PAPYR_13337 [Paratrimastix pyriformis]|uniref:Uncharacterized protein n=1 Tax=Paratrimastix pyriformis TaxID=342808 RepID=A0ABQ8U4K3_9EUKA|nr:hypothetical protein PAPYR_13337 [Paratrimastix pyriformis]
MEARMLLGGSQIFKTFTNSLGILNVHARVGGWVGSESLLFVGIVGIEGPLSAANCQTQIIRTSYSNLADACRLKNLRAGAIIRSDCSSQKTRPSLATEASGSNRIMIALTLLLHALDETLAEVNASLASGDGLTLRAIPGCPEDCERYARPAQHGRPALHASVGPITMSAVPHGLPLRGATWAEHLQPLRVTLDRLRDMYAKAGCLGPAALKAPGHAAGPSPLGAVWSVAVDGMWSPDVALQYLPYIEQPWPPQFFLELHIRFVATESAAQPSTVARLRRFSDRSGFAFGTGGRRRRHPAHGFPTSSPVPAQPGLVSPTPRLHHPAGITHHHGPGHPYVDITPQCRVHPGSSGRHHHPSARAACPTPSRVRERGVAVTPATAKPTPAPGSPRDPGCHPRKQPPARASHTQNCVRGRHTPPCLLLPPT